MKNHYYDNLGMNQKELCVICAPILFGSAKDDIRSKCKIPTCPLISETNYNRWLPFTITYEGKECGTALCWVEYPRHGSTSSIINMDMIKWSV